MSPRHDEPYLTGAFYGPPIQPTKPYHHPDFPRGRNPITCCCCIICQLLITIVISIAIVGFIFWLLFRPNLPQLDVDNVSLTQFTLSKTNNTLYYNLAINMTLRNPNRRLGIYFDNITVTVKYSSMRFSTVEVESFYLGHKKEKYIGPVFKGQHLVVFDGDARSKYESEKSDEVYTIGLKLKMNIRFKVLSSKTGIFKGGGEYDLKVPLSSKGNVSYVITERNEGDFDWWEDEEDDDE